MLPELPTSPLEPPDGAFRRVRRRAFVRRMRVPAVALSLAALAGVSVGAIRPHPTASLEPVTGPKATETETYPPLPAPSPTVLPTPSLSPPVVVTHPPTATPSASPLDHGTLCPPDLSPASAGPNITGTVVDRDGRPLQGMEVWTDTCDKGLVTAATTDKNGHFSVVCTNTFVAVAAFGWRNEVPSVAQNVGFAFLNENTFWGTVPCGSYHQVTLPRGATLRVHLTDGNGDRVQPLEDWYLWLFYEKENADGIQESTWVSPGEFSFAGLAPGRYLVWDPKHGNTRVWVTVAEGQTVDVNMPTGGMASPTATPTATVTPSPTGSPTQYSTP